MFEGFWVVSLMVVLVLGVIDLMSGDTARAGTAGTILFILLCIAIRAIVKDNEMEKKRIAALKKWYPDRTDAWYRNRIQHNFDGPDIAYASQLKRIEFLKELEPGKPDWWYKDNIDNPQYRDRLFQMLKDRDA